MSFSLRDDNVCSKQSKSDTTMDNDDDTDHIDEEDPEPEDDELNP